MNPAYDQGYAAFLARDSRDSNPYAWSTIAHTHWFYGYDDATRINARKEQLDTRTEREQN